MRHMVLLETYRFDRTDYDNGRHRVNPEFLFTDFIVECERRFHQKFGPLYANAILANANVLLLIRSCFDDNDNLFFGMESVDGDFDIDENMKIESYSANQTVYALGSGIDGRDDEPVLLVSDGSFNNYQFALKHIPDNDSDGIIANVPTLGSRVTARV